MKSEGAVTKLPTTLIDWAQLYAKNGWRVFPILPMIDGICTCSEGSMCARPGKHPAIKAWQKNASVDADQILAWWDKWPKAGIGIATGKESNLTILDVDIGPAGGDVTMNRLRGKNAMPSTPAVETGSGGWHYYFTYTPEVKTVAKKIGAGLDTRNDGGYVVAPPSLHAGGRKYKWMGKWKEQMAKFPDWLLGEEAEEARAEGSKAGRPRKEKFNPDNPNDVDRLRNALQFVDCEDYDKWFKVGLIMARAFQWSAVGEAMYLEWASRAGSGYDHKKSRRNYTEESRKPREGRILTTASIYDWAQENPAYVPATISASREFTVVDSSDDVQAVLMAMEKATAAVPGLFARGGDLVRVAMLAQESFMTGWGHRDAGATVLVPYTALTLAADLSTKLSFITENDEGKSKRIEIPQKRAQAMLDRATWPLINELRGFAPHPVFAPDGRIVAEEGYDKETGLYITRTVKITSGPPISQAQAKILFKRIMAPMVDFEWESDIDRAIYIAAFFTTGLRYRFPAAPLFGFSAHAPGSGKGLLTDVIGMVWLGARASKIAWSPIPEELEKRLGAYLRAGDPLICFDNVERGRKFHDPTLCGVLTSTKWDFRILGKSEKVQLPTNATFMATGNALTATGDTARRTLVCRIDPKAEDPSLRQNFKYPNLVPWIAQHRDEILSAAIDVVRGYMSAGEPNPNKWTLGSFEDWSLFIDGLLVWLGEASLAEYARRGNSGDAESADVERDFLLALSRLAFEEVGKTYSTIELTTKIAGSSELSNEFRAAYASILHAQSGFPTHIEVNVSTVGMLMKAIAGQFRQIEFGEKGTMVRVTFMVVDKRNKQKRWGLEERDLNRNDSC